MSSSVPDELNEALERARSAPDSDEAWDELDELARGANQPDDVSKVYLEVLATDLSPALTSHLGERAVAFHEEWFEDTSHVIDILRRVLSVDAGADWAFERLSLLLTMAERWDDLLAEYDRALDASDDPEKKKALLDEAARIAKDFAGQTNRAIGYLKALVPLRPEDAQLAQSLERRLVLQKRFGDLIDVWTARLGVMDGAEATATRVRIAETWLTKLKDAATALAAVEELLASEGAAEEACRLLEMIGTRESAEQQTRRSALALLKEQLLARGLAAEVISALELQLGVAEGKEELTALRREARDRLAELERHAEAVEHGAALLVLSPTAEERARLAELVEQAGAHDAFVDALVRGADAAEDPAVRVDFVIEAGCRAQDRLEDAARAIQLLSRALSDDAAEPAQLLDVARRLTDLLQGEEHAEQRLAVLERRATLEPEVEERRRVLGEAARLAEARGDADHALALWRKRLEAESEDMEALDASAAILEQGERWEALVELLDKRAEAHGEGTDARRADLVRIASVHQRKLENVERAIEVWRGIQEEYGSSTETIDALANLSAAARRWTDVVGLLRAAADGEEDSVRRANQLARMGDVYRTERNSAARAVESYREAVQVDPRHEMAREGLRALLEHPDSGRDAVETLTQAHKAADEWEGILGLVERRIELAPDKDFEKAVLVDAAWIVEHRAEDLGRALQLLRRAFAAAPQEDIEQDLRRLADATGDWATAAGGYAEAIEGADDGAGRNRLLMSHGAILEDRLGDFGGALASFERVAKVEPGQVEAARAVARVGPRVAAWPQVAAVFVASSRELGELDDDTVGILEQTVTGWDAFTGALDAAIEAAELDNDIAHRLLERLALWHRDRREDPGLAEEALERAVAKRPEAQTLRTLAEIQREAPGRALVTTLLRLAAATDEDLDALHEAGNVALLAVQDNELGRPILEQVLAVAERRWRDAEGDDAAQPERFALWAIDNLVRIDLEADEAESAVELLVRGARLPCAPEVSRQLRFRAAQTAADALGDTARAVKLCTGILDEAPDDASAMGLLASLYSKEGRLADLLKLRRRELALDRPTERRLELRLDIVRVLGELDGDAQDRVAALLDNLVDLPGHDASVDTLATLLEEEERHEELLDVLSQQAALVQEVGDVTRGAALWARAGQLAEDPVGDIDRALEAYRRSVELDSSLPVLDALARIHTDREQHGVAVKWLEKRLAGTGRGDDEVLAYRETVHRLAKAQDAAGQEERARETLVEALHEDPAASDLRDLLADLYRESEEWELLAPLLAAGVEYAPDAGAQVTLLRQAAQVHRRRLGDVEAAIPLLKRAVELEPNERAPRLALADALRVGERYDEARDLLTQLLEEFGRRRTPERAAVHFHLARIARACGDLDEALSQLESASSIERSDARILQLLGVVAREKGDLDRAERAYRALLLIVRRQQATEDEEDLVAGSEIMYDLHRIASEQGQNDRANDLLESAFETAAENNFEALRLERVLRAAGHTQHVLRVLDTRLARIDDPAAATEILCARADLLAELDRVEEALDSLLEALARTPTSAKLSAAAYDLAVRAGAVDRYVLRLSTAAESAEEPRAASALWFRLGQTAQNDLEDSERAIGFYERSLATGVRAHRAYQALLAVVPEEDEERRGRALRGFALAPEDSEGDPALRTEALYAVATTELAAAETCDAGIEHLEEALRREVRTEAALELLRKAAGLLPGSERVVRTFERVAREAGHPDVLLEALVLASRLDSASVELVQDAIDLAREQEAAEALAALLERLVGIARATDAIDSFVWAVIEHATLREAADDAETAVALLDEAAALSEGAEAFDLRLRVATLAAGALGDTERAASTYEALLEQEPADSRVWNPLLDLYRVMGARARLEACISKTIDVVLDPAERNTLRMERGRILLDDPEREEEAEASLREVLDEDPNHVQASFVLAELLERTGRSDELAELLQRQLEGARERGDAEAVASLALRIGTALEESSPDDALALYKDSLAVAPESRVLLEAILRLIGGEGDAYERADITERLLAVEQGEAAADLALELAALRRSLDDAVSAERALAMGFKACPTRSDIREQLEQLYEETENHVGVAELLVLDAAARQDVEAAVARFRRAAAIHFDELGDPTMAASVLAQARARAPGDVTLTDKQIEYLTVAGRTDEAFALVTEAAENEALGPPERAGFLSRRAQLRLESGDDGVEPLAEALRDADRAQELTDGGYRELVAQVLERLRDAAAAAEDEERERSATMRLASLLPKLGDHRRGLELLVGWVKRFPSDAGAVRELGHFAAATEKWSAAAKAYQRLVEITEGDEQVDAVVRLAEACEKADNPMAAKEALEGVYARAPHNEMVRGRLRRMYEAAEEYEALANIIMAEAEQAESDDVRFERLVEAAQLSLRVAGGERTAIAAYRQALELRPDSNDTAIGLADTLAQAGEIEEAANLLDAAINAHGKRRTPELSQLQHSMARVGRIAEDHEAVLAWLEAAVQSDRQNGAAAAELAVLAMERGELDTAIKALQAVALLKEPGPMSRAEAYLRQGMIAEQKGDRKKAVFLAKRALTTESEYEDAKLFLEQIGG